MLMPDGVKGIIYLLIILSILVIVHEWGHYIAARFFKMRVEEFSLFFGKILVRLGKRGDTEFNIRAIPLGGFVRIAGMEADDVSGGRPILEAIRHPQFVDKSTTTRVIEQLDNDTMAGIEAANISDSVREMLHAAIGPDGRLTPEGRAELEAKLRSPQITTDDHKLIQMVQNADVRANDPGLYSQKPVYQRALVIFAGPFMSLLFGYLIFCILGMTVGLEGKEYTNQVQVAMAIADRPEERTPARAAGMLTGDRIVAIDGEKTPDGKALVEKIHKSANKPLRLTIQRNGQTLELVVTPRPLEQVVEKDGKRIKKTIGVIGVQPLKVWERRGLLASIYLGTAATRDYITTLVGILFSKEVKDNIGGPIAMGQTVTAVQRLGLAHLILMAAAFSLSLGVLNLLPIPILDGGHLLLLAIEKIRRRKLSPREIYRAQMVGLGLLALIVSFVMYNDIVRTITGKAIQ